MHFFNGQSTASTRMHVHPNAYKRTELGKYSIYKEHNETSPIIDGVLCMCVWGGGGV